jgi:hypothetical protein
MKVASSISPRRPVAHMSGFPELGLRRLRLFRTFTHDFKAKLEEELSGGERHRLTQLLARADDALEGPHQPEWWLAP